MAVAVTTPFASDLEGWKQVTDPAEIEASANRPTNPSLHLSWEIIDHKKNIFSIKLEAKLPGTTELVEVFRQEEVGPTRERVYEIWQEAKVQLNKFYAENGVLPAPGKITVPAV